MIKRVSIFIDGGNFYFKLKELRNKTGKNYSLLGFDFRGFAQWLVGERKIGEIRYYIGTVKRQKNNEKSEIMYGNQQRLLRYLQKQNIVVSLGQLIRHPDKTYHEKGVDVRIAVEMIRYARQDKYDICYLLSSDTDLVPAVEEVKDIGKEVCYVGIANGQSFGLSVVADDVRLIRPEEIEQFFSQNYESK
ncbi:NYN domain-containing protein [Candidatus Gribaldobacteria bacterium]|nr:NYN domain-containing protein [Candidatus Gribaldobacteria bacterium]